MSVGVTKDYKLKVRNLHASLTHWVGLGTGTPKDRDKVNKREVCECDGFIVYHYKNQGSTGIIFINREFWPFFILELVYKFYLWKHSRVCEKAVWLYQRRMSRSHRLLQSGPTVGAG
jgi:hypothetical protein